MAPWKKKESMSQFTTARARDLDDIDVDRVENLARTISFDDPHRAALEDNPDKPETLSLTTIGAIFVWDAVFVGFLVQC